MERRGFPPKLGVPPSLVKGHCKTSALESLLLCFLFYCWNVFFIVFFLGSKLLETCLSINMHSLWLVARLG